MSTLSAHFMTLATPGMMPIAPNSTPPTTGGCLILSDFASRQEMFGKAAAGADWSTTCCDTAAEAWAAATNTRFDLIIVDLDGCDTAVESDLRDFAEQADGESKPLVIVCGAEGNPLQEIWARQIGAWLYLAGVDPSCDIAGVCRQAREVAEKLSPARDETTPVFSLN